MSLRSWLTVSRRYLFSERRLLLRARRDSRVSEVELVLYSEGEKRGVVIMNIIKVRLNNFINNK